jgi:hypothetical protein
MSGKLVIVSGAVLHCSAGSEPSTLVATSEATVGLLQIPTNEFVELGAPGVALGLLQGPASKLLGALDVASVKDHKAGTNIKPFGNCKIKEDRENKPGHKCPCGKPETPNPWTPGEADVALPTTSPILIEGSHLDCKQGGTIEIVSPGQSIFSVEGPGGHIDWFAARIKDGKLSVGPSFDAHTVRIEATHKVPVFDSFDLDADGYVSGPSLFGDLGVHNNSLGASLGANAGSAGVSVSKDIGSVKAKAGLDTSAGMGAAVHVGEKGIDVSFHDGIGFHWSIKW